MTWVRLDEAFAQHPKVVKVGPLGMALHVAALCYCNTYLTDGYIPTAAARTLLDFEDYGGSKQVIKDLVNNGLWDEVADGYQLHDYHDYQPTKQQVIELRTKKQAAGQAGGKASAQAKRVAKSNPVPVPGSVSEPNTATVSAPPERARARNIEVAKWKPNPDLIEWVSREYPDVDIVVETEKFIDHFSANGKPMKDWDAAWRNWMRRSRDFGAARSAS